MIYYVILESWGDVLYKMNGWSKSYYLATMYYKSFVKTHPDSIFTKYDCNSILELLLKLKCEYGTDVYDINSCQLMVRNSNDNKLTVVYKAKYNYLFDFDTMVVGLRETIIKEVGITSLSLMPLLSYTRNLPKYTKSILFSIYYNIHGGGKNVDLVYIWYYMLNDKNRKLVVPNELIFI